MASSPPANTALALVHQGWDHLKLQRPLAAWACWQRALRLEPGDRAATEALAVLERAHDLPAAARKAYRLRFPSSPERRTRWNEQLEGRDIQDLDIAASAFRSLAAADPNDGSAWYNLGLCLAWQGKNAEAIDALHAFVAIHAAEPDGAAAEAWALAEILRAGAGAERLADDLGHALVLDWGPDDPELTSLPGIRPVTSPVDPQLGDARLGALGVFEWLDRPMPEASESLTLAELPRVLATVVQAPGSLRLSSPGADSLREVESRLRAILASGDRPVRRESSPLPLRLLDAAVWTIRMPEALDLESRRRLARSAVEHYYENLWIHAERRGLEGRSPLAVSRELAGGGGEPQAPAGLLPRLKAELEGVLLVREQLGARPGVAELYGGYPFDRLRRRLGLEPDRPDTVDPADYSCMSGAELDRLAPSALDDIALAEAHESAAGLRDDARTARYAAARDDRRRSPRPPGTSSANPDRPSPEPRP